MRREILGGVFLRIGVFLCLREIIFAFRTDCSSCWEIIFSLLLSKYNRKRRIVIEHRHDILVLYFCAENLS